MNGSPAIETHALTKRYGKAEALDGLDLAVAAGWSLGLLGPSGAGKSTLLRILAGLARPTSGSAAIGGHDAWGRGGVAARRRLGVIHQVPRFHDWMTGRELLELASELGVVDPGVRGERIDGLVARLELGEVVVARIGTWTAAERARLGWAVALVAEPDVVLLDDPFASLDADGAALLGSLIVDLRYRGATVMLATRRPEDVERHADHVAVVDGGRLLAIGPVDELGSRGAAPAYVVDVAGPSALALAGLVARLRGEPWVASAVADGQRLRVAVSDEARAGRELLPAIVSTGLAVDRFGRESDRLGAAYRDLLAR